MQHSAKKGAGEITEKCQMREAAQAEATATASGRVATRTSPSTVPAPAPFPAPFRPVAIYVLATLH